MSLMKAITVSEATVPAGSTCRLHSICFNSDDADIHVKIREDGVVGGTVRLYILKDLTTAIGDETFTWTAGDPKGVALNNGMYVDFTNDGGTTAGTGTINVEYTPE